MRNGRFLQRARCPFASSPPKRKYMPVERDAKKEGSAVPQWVSLSSSSLAQAHPPTPHSPPRNSPPTGCRQPGTGRRWQPLSSSSSPPCCRPPLSQPARPAPPPSEFVSRCRSSPVLPTASACSPPMHAAYDSMAIASNRVKTPRYDLIRAQRRKNAENERHLVRASLAGALCGSFWRPVSDAIALRTPSGPCKKYRNAVRLFGSCSSPPRPAPCRLLTNGLCWTSYAIPACLSQST